MATDDLFIRLGLKGQAATSSGLRKVAGETRAVGTAAEVAGAKAHMMGAAFTGATNTATFGVRRLVGALGLIGGTYGIGRLTSTFVKWGLSTNAQIESARIRFSLFTDDVNGLTRDIRKLDAESAMFGFADLADTAALLGNSDVKDIPNVLRGIANAAAAAGSGAEGMRRIALNIAQIQSLGRVTGDELRELTQAGAPGTMRIIQKEFGLTAKEMQNIGAQGLDARRAINALVRDWTSGKMAAAAKKQGQTLGGQWARLNTNMRLAAGAATESLADGLRDDVLPAANKAVEQITRIFGDDGLTNQEKLRRAREVIRRELGPIADDIGEKIDEADIPGKLGDIVRLAAPKMAQAAADVAPDVAKAFVDAWLNSGPWAQIATLLFIGKKGVDAGRWMPKGGGGLGGLAGKAAPVPVFVTNWGGKVPGGPPIPAPTGPVDKTPGWAKNAKRVGRVAGPLAVAFGIAEGIRAVAPGFGQGDHDSRAGGGSVRRQAAGTIMPPGFGGQVVVSPTVQTDLYLDGGMVARYTHNADARKRARK